MLFRRLEDSRLRLEAAQEDSDRERRRRRLDEEDYKDRTRRQERLIKESSRHADLLQAQLDEARASLSSRLDMPAVETTTRSNSHGPSDTVGGVQEINFMKHQLQLARDESA